MAYIGNDLQVAFQSYKVIDDISSSFNGSTTSFALLVNGSAPVPLPINSQQCLISVAGVIQRPDDSGTEGFRLSGSNIVFSSAPATGADFFGVILAGADYVNAGGTFPDGTAAAPSITFSSDPNTGLYSSGADQVSISTGGTERTRFTSNGEQQSVSLGTASAPAYSFVNDPNTGIYSPGADSLAISTNGTNRLHIDSDGKVGIGTTSPDYPLEVAKDSGIIALIPNASNGNTLRFGGVGGSANQLIFAGASDVERARIDSSGKLLSPNGAAFYGTVSNSGNGAIMERGSNANGDFTKYADGAVVFAIRDTESRSSSGTVTTNVTFPVALAVSPATFGYVVACTNTSVPATASSISVNGTNSTTGCEVRIERSNSTNTSFYLTGYGRWY